MLNIIWINPQDIQKMSPIAGSANTRKKSATRLNCYWKNIFLHGNWDLGNRILKDSQTATDYSLYKNNKGSVYPWEQLENSIKEKGYVQNPKDRYIEVSIGRTGELFMVDGRHRLYLAQILNIPLIPVNVLDIHPEYDFQKLNIIQNEVIPEFIYNLIRQKWDKEIIVYHEWKTIEQRYNLVKKYLPLLKNLNVLEVGANSGMMMWSIMKYANSLIELEHQEKYANQCKITKQYLDSGHNKMVFPLCCSLLNFYDDIIEFNNIQALYASFVLYHLNDQEIEILKTKILPQCKVVIIPNRLKERSLQKNSYHLNRNEEIEKLLKSCGFSRVTIDNTIEKGYSVIVGTK
jgi:hypothetical protein